MLSSEHGGDFYGKIPNQMNLCDMLVDEHVRKGRGSNVAIVYQDQNFTYDWLKSTTGQFAHAVTKLGLEIENRFMLLLHDCPQYIAAFLGGIRLGAVPICINTMLNADNYRFILEDSRSKVLVTNPELWVKIQPFRDQLTYLRHVILVTKESDDITKISRGRDIHLWDGLLSDASKDFPPARTYKNDVALWLYSSGSTGQPKGTVHQAHDVLATTDLYAKEIIGIDEKSRCFSASKIFFAYGLGNALTFPLRWGGQTVLYPDRPTPEAMFSVIEKYRPTHFFGVPTLFTSMLAYKDASKRDISSVKFVVSAGEALQPSVFQKWKEVFGHEILEGIGSTEMLHIFISNRLMEARPGSSGKLVPGYEARIVDDSGSDVQDGTVGNLLVKGESMAVLYWGRHKKTTRTMQGEWLATGDMYSRDAEGYYYYAGRGDDMLKVGGIWVSPVEVENSIMELAEVLECAVVGVPDEEGLIKPKAFVVLRNAAPGSQELVAKIQDHVKNTLAKYKYPRWVEFVPDLPKTATGKIQRFKLRGK
jgi:benzoate-CoA ligase family protein